MTRWLRQKAAKVILIACIKAKTVIELIDIN